MKGPKIIVMNQDRTVRAFECNIIKYLSEEKDGPITHVLTWWMDDMFERDSGGHHVIPVDEILYDRGDADEIAKKDRWSVEPIIVPFRIGISEELRNRVYERDGHKCVKCESTEHLSVDHIHPWSKGGKTEFDNLQTLCRICNSRKGAKVSL